MKLLPRLLLFALLLSLTAPAAIAPARAQDAGPLWSDPANISLSGAASQPRLLAAADGRLQAFWLDRFDGLMTAVFEDESWSAPQLAAIEQLEAAQMPELLVDAQGVVHAFWLQNGALFYSWVQFGAATWTEPEQLAGSVVAFQAIPDAGAGLALVYILGANEDAVPAGLYFQRLPAAGTFWGQPVSIYTSTYFRLMAGEQAWLRIANNAQGVFAAAWQDPRQERAFYTLSSDGGVTWAEPQALASNAEASQSPRLAALPDGQLLLTWQAASASACSLFQQRLTAALGWDEPQRILPDLATCPSVDRFLLLGQSLFWVWGESGSSLTLAALDASSASWSQPHSYSFNFDDPATGRTVRLDDLHLAAVDGQLAVAGSATDGEVWVTLAETSALDLAAAPPPPWSAVQRLSLPGQAASAPALAVDSDGLVHIVWGQQAQASPFSGLFYARWNGQMLSRPAEIFRGIQGEVARQPALLADSAGWLHLAWSGGTQGEILYSRAVLADAASASNWSPVQVLSAAAPAAWPQIAIDQAGGLYILYVTPINEGRGVYLVRSSDGGESWTEPQMVFDAADAGWSLVDHPALAVTPSLRSPELLDLHVAWVQASPPDTLPPTGIYYTRASLSLLDVADPAWGAPFQAAGSGADWPLLAASGGRLYLFYTIGDSGLWQRSLPLDTPPEDVSSWGTAARAPGWTNIAAGQQARSSTVVATGGPDPASAALHLVALGWADPAASLLYNTGSAERWDAPEAYVLPETFPGPALALEAAAPPEGQNLAVAWIAADENGLPALYFAARSIPQVEVAPLPTLMPTPTVQATLAPTAQPTIVPTPTPDLNRLPPPATELIPPLALSGVLAAVIVVIFFIARMLRIRSGS